MRDNPIGTFVVLATDETDTFGGGEIPVIFVLLPVDTRVDVSSALDTFDLSARPDGSGRIIVFIAKFCKLNLSVGDRLFEALNLSRAVKLAGL